MLFKDDGQSMTWAEGRRLVEWVPLPPNEKLVLLMIHAHLGVEAVCWPSVGRLERMTGLSESSVRRAVRALQAAGIVSVENRARETGGQASNRYAFNWAEIRSRVGEPPGFAGCHTDTPPGQTDSPPPVTVTPHEQISKKRSGKGRTRSDSDRGKRGVNIRSWSDTFCRAWADRYGGRYAFNGAKDAQAIKRIHDALGNDHAVWEQVVLAYLDDEGRNGYLRQQAHPLALLAMDVNKYAVRAREVVGVEGGGGGDDGVADGLW